MDVPSPPPPARRILVVDDNRDATDTMAMLLEMLGHQVRTAYDGVEALAVAEAFRPEFILLDLGLPLLSGLEVARRLRQQPDGAAFVLVALTGRDEPEDRKQSNEAGFNEHLVKPVKLAAIERVLAGQRQAP